MKIAILGTRGIPARYGGFETFAEELAIRLIKKEHEVTVYCRNSKIKNRFYKGVKLVNIPRLKGKYSDTFSYSIIANLHAALSNYDILLICGVGQGSISFLPRFFGKKIIININGTEWKRQKFSKFASLIVKICMYLANAFADTIICDSKVILKHWEAKFKKKAIFIPYGALDFIPTNTGILENYNLKKKKYILYVSRLEPENNAHILIEAFNKTNTNYNLIIVGDAPHAKEYISYLKKNKDSRIKFLGYVYGEKYIDLLCNAYLYVHGNEVGGTNPGLLNAMAYRNCVLVIDVPYNLEVIGDAGIPFQKYGNDLYIKLNYLLENPQKVNDYGEKATKRIQQHYTWDKVVNDYEKLFQKYYMMEQF